MSRHIIIEFTKTKKTSTNRTPLAIGLMAGLLLLMMQCDKFTDVEFLTKNNFILNSSSHEFDAETKHDTSISSISINGKIGIVASPNKLTKDTIIHYDGYSVRYIKDSIKNLSNNQPDTPDEHFGPAEVIGEWFTIKKSYPSSQTTHIFIDENDKDAERTLIINIGHKNTWGDITITQRKRD